VYDPSEVDEVQFKEFDPSDNSEVQFDVEEYDPSNTNNFSEEVIKNSGRKPNEPSPSFYKPYDYKKGFMDYSQDLTDLGGKRRSRRRHRSKKRRVSSKKRRVSRKRQSSRKKRR
jgi:hypothetical protein